MASLCSTIRSVRTPWRSCVKDQSCAVGREAQSRTAKQSDSGRAGLRGHDVKRGGKGIADEEAAGQAEARGGEASGLEGGAGADRSNSESRQPT